MIFIEINGIIFQSKKIILYYIMEEIINKIKIEDFKYFEIETGEEENEITYFIVLIFRFDDESKINIDSHFTSLASEFSERDIKLFRAVCIHKLMDRNKNFFLKRMYEVTTQDEFKKYYDSVKKNEEDRKEYERILKNYIFERFYNLERNEWQKVGTSIL